MAPSTCWMSRAASFSVYDPCSTIRSKSSPPLRLEGEVAEAQEGGKRQRPVSETRAAPGRAGRAGGSAYSLLQRKIAILGRVKHAQKANDVRVVQADGERWGGK